MNNNNNQRYKNIDMIEFITWVARRSALVNWGLGGIDIGGPVGFCWIFEWTRRSPLNMWIN